MIYSIPREDDDTSSKAKIDAGVHKCLICTKEATERKKKEREDKKRVKKEKQDRIVKHGESRTAIFKLQWNDLDENGNALNTTIQYPFKKVDENNEVVVDENGKTVWEYATRRLIVLSDESRLKYTFKSYDTRRAQDGFLSSEMSSIVNAEEIREIIQTAQRHEQETNKLIHDRVISREEGEERLKEIEKTKKTDLNRLKAYVERQMSLSNRNQKELPLDDREVFVTKPGYREFEGVKAPRWFLISDKDTFEEREIDRDKQIERIKDRGQLEKEVSEKNQPHFDEITGQYKESQKE